MGGSGGGEQRQESQSGGTTHQVTEVKLPEWVDKGGQANYALAQSLAEKPYVGYEGTVVPEFSELTNDTVDYIRNNMGVYQNAYDSAMNFNSKLAGTGGVQEGNMEKYLNPYTNEVEKRAIANAETEQAKKLRGIDTNMAAGHSFGSRGAIERAVQGSEGVREIGDLSSKLRLQGYDKAREYQQADWKRQQFNDEWLKSLSAQNVDAAGKAQAGMSQDYFNALSAGKMVEDKNAEQLAETYAKWKEEHDYPLEMLNVRLAALGMTPYGHTETTDKQESGWSRSLKSGGGGGAAEGITGGLGIMKALLPMMGMMSDRTMKTDIEELGTDKASDLPIYAYRYKSDPKTYPKTVGPMAQDVEKKYPKAVHKVLGKKVIDFTQIPLGL